MKKYKYYKNIYDTIKYGGSKRQKLNSNIPKITRHIFNDEYTFEGESNADGSPNGIVSVYRNGILEIQGTVRVVKNRLDPVGVVLIYRLNRRGVEFRGQANRDAEGRLNPVGEVSVYREDGIEEFRGIATRDETGRLNPAHNTIVTVYDEDGNREFEGYANRDAEGRLNPNAIDNCRVYRDNNTLQFYGPAIRIAGILHPVPNKNVLAYDLTGRNVIFFGPAILNTVTKLLEPRPPVNHSIPPPPVVGA